MNLHFSMAARRTVAAAAVTCAAAALAPAAALASPGLQAEAARTATPSCTTSGLDVWLDTPGNAALGTTDTTWSSPTCPEGGSVGQLTLDVSAG